MPSRNPADTYTGIRAVTVGHTPDMDDAFMFFGIASGVVPTDGFRFEHVVEDIQALNRRALHAELDMTAISAASYPLIAKEYAIVSVGSSVGRSYGPLVISREPTSPEELEGKRIAVPGLHTTAYLLLQMAFPRFIPVEKPFEEVPQAVLRGEVDAGLVIHEWQLTYRDAGLLPVLDLGTWWQQHARLPLPLGLNVIKRSLGRKTGSRIAAVFRNSILHAMANQDDALAYAMRYSRGTDSNRSRQFISMYVNQETLALTPGCRKALRLLFTQAARAGLIERVPRLSVVEPSNS
ncbi:MAG TPA: MqnA/MqnD/SBP family protein [bacterium]